MREPFPPFHHWQSNNIDLNLGSLNDIRGISTSILNAEYFMDTSKILTDSMWCGCVAVGWFLVDIYFVYCMWPWRWGVTCRKGRWRCTGSSLWSPSNTWSFPAVLWPSPASSSRTGTSLSDSLDAHTGGDDSQLDRKELRKKEEVFREWYREGRDIMT